jgi:hypothetical protein
MSGPRPPHLVRRGAVYAVRFRLPVAIAEKLGLQDIQRSLGTADPQIARRRCLAATIWFKEAMERLRRMPELGRTDLEEAARQFFKGLVAGNDARRNVDPDDPDRELDYVVAIAGERIGELEIQLRTNHFDRKVRHAAEEIAALTDTPFSDLAPERQLTAEQLAARAEREHWRHVDHVLREPWKPFASDDVLFELNGGRHAAPSGSPRRPDCGWQRAGNSGVGRRR